MSEAAYRDVTAAISSESMKKLLEHFSSLHRLTGKPDCEKAAAYIIEQLKAYGIDCELYQFDGYFSDPIKSELTVYGEEDGTIVPSKPRSFSLNCPSGITGELIYDHSSQGAPVNKMEEKELYSRFRGKVVLSWNFYEDYVKKIEAYGAIGLVHIWPTDEKVIHEETVGPIWGTPTQDNYGWLPAIPVVGLKKEDGTGLLERVKRETVKVRLRSWVENHVAPTSLPVAWIPGKTEDYVLVSGHYDSWHEGITDNAVGNAVCLEMARVFSQLPGKMERGVKIAFWPGHSNGRYMGSTWFCDHFWQELHDRCAAHLNIDSPGSQGGAAVLPRTTCLEGKEFTARLIKEFTGNSPMSVLDIPRGADQSFWGTGIPFHIMYKYEPVPEKKLYSCPGSGGGWWWHSEYDSMDKVDYDILLRDAALNTATAYMLASAKRLPADFESYFNRLLDIIKNLDEHSDAAFDFQPVLKAMSSLKEKVIGAMNGLSDDGEANRLIREIGGNLSRLMYSSGSEYEFDNTFPSKPFQGLQQVSGVYKDNTPADQFLFAYTGFIRHQNRIINEIRELNKKLL